MPDTDVNLRVNETGATRAAAQMDRLQTKTRGFSDLAPKIAQAGIAIGSLGQVARLISPEFDKLGQSISNVALAAAGLGQIGAIFGPIGAAIGTIGGGLIGLITELSRAADRPITTNVNVTNNVEMTAKITGESVRSQLSQISAQFDRPIRDLTDQIQDQVNQALQDVANNNLAGF